MKKLKPIIISFVILLAAFCCNVSADVVIDERGNITASDIYDMSQFGYYKVGSDGDIFISYDDLYSRYVGVICLKSDEEIFDLTSLTYQEINDKTVYIGATFVDADGNVSVSFRLPPRNGKYTVAFINKKLGTQLLGFEYESKLHFEYNDSVSIGVEGVLEFLNSNKEVLPMNIIGYDILGDDERRSIAGILYGQGEAETSDKLNEMISSLPIEKMVFEELEKEDVLLYIKKCNESEYSPFANAITKVFLEKLSENTQLDIVSELIGSEFTEENEKEFQFKTLKSYVATFGYFAEIEDVIKNEDNIWKFSQKTLKKYGDIKNKNAVMNKMFEEIKTVTSIDEYRNSFDTIVSEIYNEENKKPAGGSGGGGSMGSGGGGGMGTGSVDNIRVDDTIKDLVIPETTTPTVTTPEVNFKDLGGFDWAKEAVDSLTKNGIINGVSESSFAPANLVKREEFVKMIASALKLTGIDANVSFDDVDKSAWYYSSVCALTREKIINGVSATMFGIGDNITREDMAVILCRVYDFKKLTLEKQLTALFADESSISDYALESVNKLAGLKIISGYEDGSFKPKSTLSRAEAAVVIYRFFTAAGLIN